MCFIHFKSIFENKKFRGSFNAVKRGANGFNTSPHFSIFFFTYRLNQDALWQIRQ